jgi:hypothetical protein
MEDEPLPPRARRGRIPQPVVVAVGLGVLAVALAGLGVQAIRGNRTVGVQRQAITIHNATLDDSFYRCIDVQAHSLVSPSQPVVITGNLGDVVTLIKGVGSWVTIANPFSSASARLSLRDNVTGRHACLGTVVIATYPKPGRRPVVRVGSGASVPGHGPPPAPPL